jgi:uncharacterized protein (TIGR00730 family)
MPPISRLCVYCGSAGAVDSRYRQAARELGERLAAAGIELVFGGGRIGLMGIAADAVLAGGGRVIGVIPERLRDAELAHQGVNELVITAGMHDRKRVMAERADAFAVLPGGMGTMDETFEILTWKQLHLHNKPIVIVNQHDYWTAWLDLASHVISQGFARPDTARLYTVVADVAEVLAVVRTEIEHAAGGEPKLF